MSSPTGRDAAPQRPAATPAAAPGGVAVAEVAEVARLRAAVDALRLQNESLQGRLRELEALPAGTDRAAGAPVALGGAAIALLVLGCLLAPLAVLSVWARNTVLDTVRYVATLAPLASEPVLQQWVAAAVTDQLFQRVDVQTAAREALPERAAFLAGPLTWQLRDFTTAAVQRVVAAPQFRTIWEQANRRSHRLVVGALTGQGNGALVVRDGTVSLDLEAVATQVKDELRRQGVGLFDAVPAGAIGGQVVLLQSDAVAGAQLAVGLLQGGATILPLALLVAFGAGLWLAPDRRRAALWIGVGFAVAMVALGLALGAARGAGLSALEAGGVPRDAAAIVFDTVARTLRDGVRAGLVAGLVVATGAALMGPAAAAVRLRGALGERLRGAGGRAAAAGWDGGPVGRWVARHRGALRVAALVAGGLALVWWEQPTAGTVLGVTAAVLVALALVEVLGQAPALPGDSAGDVSPSLSPPAA